MQISVNPLPKTGVLILVAGLAAGLATFTGCGGDESGSGQNGANDDSSSGTAKGSSKEVPAGEATVDSQGRVMIGGIPLNVWFDNPLAVAKNTQTVATTANGSGQTNGATTAQAPSNPSNAVEDPKPGAGKADWGEVISMAVLEDETKRIRNYFTANMKTVATYNKSYKEIRIQAATLSAIAGIVIEHPETIRWKDNAAYVRDIGLQMDEAAIEGSGRPNYEKVQAPFERLIVVLDGGKPTEAESPMPKVPFAEHADRGGLMNRMKASQEWLRLEINTEERFQSKAAQLLLEAGMMTALSQVVADKSYDSADEEKYIKFAGEMVAAGRQMTQSVQNKDYAGFQGAMDIVQKKCDECHRDYRFGGN